jgi:hypothetical protein
MKHEKTFRLRVLVASHREVVLEGSLGIKCVARSIGRRNLNILALQMVGNATVWLDLRSTYHT